MHGLPPPLHTRPTFSPCCAAWLVAVQAASRRSSSRLAARTSRPWPSRTPVGRGEGGWSSGGEDDPSGRRGHSAWQCGRGAQSPSLLFPLPLEPSHPLIRSSRAPPPLGAAVKANCAAVSNAMLIGDRRKFVGLLLTFKVSGGQGDDGDGRGDRRKSIGLLQGGERVVDDGREGMGALPPPRRASILWKPRPSLSLACRQSLTQTGHPLWSWTPRHWRWLRQ